MTQLLNIWLCWNYFKSLTPSIQAYWSQWKFGVGSKSSEWSLYLLKTSLRHWKPRLQFALLCLALISSWEYWTVLKLFKFTLKHKKGKKRRISSKVCLTLKSSCMKKSLRLLWKLCKGNDWQVRVRLICRTNAQSDHKSLWNRFSERCISPSNDYRENKKKKKKDCSKSVQVNVQAENHKEEHLCLASAWQM